ncbi:unnamed protein product, partial [marine sediment metagenome]
MLNPHLLTPKISGIKAQGHNHPHGKDGSELV